MHSYILHGDNSTLSRRKLSELIAEAKKNNWEIVRMNWASSKKQELMTLAQSQNLLSLGTLVVVENFFANNKKANELLSGLKLDESVAFIFWEGKTVTPSHIKNLKSFTLLEFKIPTVIFNFLNSLSPQNTKIMLNLLSESLKKDAPDLLLVMIARHVRNLAWVKVEPESFAAPDWMKRNLTGQAGKFTKEQLVDLHHKLLELDRASKTSQLPENLQSSLELLVASL